MPLTFQFDIGNKHPMKQHNIFLQRNIKKTMKTRSQSKTHFQGKQVAWGIKLPEKQETKKYAPTPIRTESSLKADAVNLIMRDWYRNQNEALSVEREVLYSVVEEQTVECVAKQHRITNQQQVLRVLQGTNDHLHTEIATLDGILRAILQRYPTVAWEMRAQIAYDDIPVADPEETEVESIRSPLSVGDEDEREHFMPEDDW